MIDERVDIIVPTIKGREESLERCLSSFETHTHANLNCIVIRDSVSCGQGWIEGLERSDAPYVALIADDLELVNPDWLEVCIEATEDGVLPCPRVFRPDGAIESQGGDMKALGHIISRHRKDGTRVDFTTVPFMSREQVEEVGMVPTQYCCDVWVSYRGRQLGYETYLTHGFDLVHYQEQVGRGAGMDQNERDAQDAEIMFRELAYSSHTPHLRYVLSQVKPKRVLEIGSGRYSTAEFLRCESVEEIDSVETSEVWRAAVERAFKDRRLGIYRECPREPSDYDLVFIDGPDTEAERLQSIRHVLDHEHPVTVIHDAEHPPYRAVIEEYGDAEYLGEGRQTAVIR